MRQGAIEKHGPWAAALLFGLVIGATLGVGATVSRVGTVFQQDFGSFASLVPQNFYIGLAFQSIRDALLWCGVTLAGVGGVVGVILLLTTRTERFLSQSARKSSSPADIAARE